jgi:23S rRNA (pseudouridine1915-N3)-methyltransferase
VHIRLLAIGDRQPAWVDEAFRSYSGRLPREWRFRLDTVAVAKRRKNEPATRAIEAEGRQLLARIAAEERLILLDEHGAQMTSKALAKQLSDWQSERRNLVFVVGGPDGVAETCRQRADFTWSLSDLTLPHGLARVLVAEQLFRACSLLSGHPYHRD